MWIYTPIPHTPSCRSAGTTAFKSGVQITRKSRGNKTAAGGDAVHGEEYNLFRMYEMAPLEDITVTFIEDRYPRSLFSYLDGLGCDVEETRAGIYRIGYAKMEAPAIQFIERKRLSADENLWLKSLGYGLGVADLDRVLKESLKDGYSAVKGAYLDLLLTVNRETAEEMTMRKIVTWEDIFEKTGQIKEWEERVEKRLTQQIEERITTQVEKRTAAEREQLRRENERLRQEIERMRSPLGA